MPGTPTPRKGIATLATNPRSDTADVPRDINALANFADNFALDFGGLEDDRDTIVPNPKDGTYFWAYDSERIFRYRDPVGWEIVSEPPPADPDKVFRTSINFLVAGTVTVPVGETDVIPAAFVPNSAGQAVTLVGVRHKITTPSPAWVTFKLQRNGIDIFGLTNLTAAAAETEDAVAVPLSNGAAAGSNSLQVVVTAVSGSPKNLSIGLVLEHTV